MKKRTQKQKSGHIRVTLAGEVGREPPTEFRIFPLGFFGTDKGTFLFDSESGRLVMAERDERGNDLSIDYEHQAVSDPPQPAPAAGWFDVELRDDGLYAVNLRWTDKAAEHLRAGEYRYFSPTFVADADTGRVLSLFNVALTNTPATHRMQPLVAMARDARTQVVALRASFDQISSAVREALLSRFGLRREDFPGIWLVEVYDDFAIYERDSRLYQVAYHFDGAKAVITGDPVEVRRTYEPVTPAAAGAAPEEEGTMKTILKALGLPETATEAEALQALSARDQKHAAALAPVNELAQLTGKATTAEALAVTQAWKQSADQVVTLTAKVNELEAAAEKRERDALIAAGLADKKLTPATKVWAEGQSVAALKAFLEVAPKITALSASPTKEPASGAINVGEKRYEDLKPREKAALYTESRETYEALKADYERRLANPLAS